MSDLDVIGTLGGTDKSSVITCAWDYLRHYEELFSRWRDSNINVIEIGVFEGASLDAWRWYFRKATIVGIDINPDCLRFSGNRVVIKVGSQDDRQFLRMVSTEYRPTIVIDDGSHIAHHIIASFEELFPSLMPGGLYVIEDLAFHFEDGVIPVYGHQYRHGNHQYHQGNCAAPLYDYLGPLIRARAANVSSPEGVSGFLRYAFEQIDTITLFGGGIAIRKRAPRDIEHDISTFEAELQRMPEHAVAAQRFRAYLMKHGVQTDRYAKLLQDISKAERDEN